MSDVSHTHFVCYSSIQPICVCVLGPPAVGKSTVCKDICQHYKLHYVSLKAIISETIAQLVSHPRKPTHSRHFYRPFTLRNGVWSFVGRRCG